MGVNLTNQYINQTFQKLTQVSGSSLTDGTGSLITDLDITASNASTASFLTGLVESASYAQTASFLTGTIESASHAEFADVSLTATSATTATTASYVSASNIDGLVPSSSTATSASHAEFSVTSSFALNFNPSATASYADYATSASYAITASHVDGTIDSASYAISSSHAEFADLAADANDLIVGVKNTLGVTISKGQTLHATGVTGENIDVITASNDSDMPAIGLALTDINASATGNAIISGKIIGIDTSTFVAGNNVYVGRAGAITATKPTGSSFIQNIGIVGKVDASDGELVVLGSGRTNDLPNLTTDYVWKGDANGVPQAVASSSLKVDNATSASYAVSSSRSELAGSATSATSASFASNANTATSASHAVQADSAITATSATTATSASHAVRSDISDDIASTANITVNQITASSATFTSASIGNLTTITGSATIIGDQYIILNSDAPTARFAGIKVYDSGSANTGSFEWDSVDDNWIQVETGGTSAGMLTGPSGSKGSEVYPTANTLIKGTGNHTVVDTNITDDGSTVKINSNSQITGSVNITGSTTVQGDVNFNIDQPAAASNTQILSAPGFTGTAGTNNGKTITINELVYQNFPAFGATYENSYMFSQWDGFSYNYGFDLSAGAGRIQALNIASGSGTNAQRSANFSVLDDTNTTNTPEGDAVARYYGRTMELGLYNSETIAIGNNIVNPQGYTTANTHLTAEDKILIGSTQDTTYPYKGVTRSFLNGKPTKDIEFYYTGSTSFIQSGSTAKPAVQITGSLNITGSARNASSIVGNLKQTLASPGNNQQYDLINVPTSTIDSLTYNNINNFYADYSSFGSGYKDYFAIEYYDGFGYNYGSEFSVNGVQARLSQLPGNTQFGDFKIQKKKPADIASGRGTVSGSHVLMQAGGTGSQAMINAYNGASVQIQSVGSQGGDVGYINMLATGSIQLNSQGQELFLKSGTNTGGGYISVSGSVAQPVKTVSISSNTGSMYVGQSNFHTITLVSGSDTHLDATGGGGTIKPGSTISLEVKQPTTATDSYGTLSFAPEFKFAGGTAPTITAASGALDVLTFQTYDGSTFYGTAIQNFS